MIRRFNYTERKKIKRENVKITLNKQKGKLISFSAEISLIENTLPKTAKVYIELKHKSEFRRFKFGEVQEIKATESTNLENFPYPDNLNFSVIVVDETDGKGLILARADGIRAESDTKDISVLPVIFEDLGHKIWEIDFYYDNSGPILKLNKIIPEIQSLAKSDPAFIMCVYPEVIKEVINHMIFVQTITSINDPAIEWHKNWLEFSKIIMNGSEPPDYIIKENENYSEEESISWINDVVSEFCYKRAEWNGFINTLNRSSNND